MKVYIVIGDKIVNDFYIVLEELFKIIGGLFYLYEFNLCCFVKVNEVYIVSCKFLIYFWKYENYSFYFKGIWVDKCYMFIIGNNFNLCVWKFDFENVILICDDYYYFIIKFEVEIDNIL